MSQQSKTPSSTQNGHISHPLFAAFYEHSSHSDREKRILAPLREELIRQARGRVLEIGAGNGLNFPFFDPATVEQVEALEPDSSMVKYGLPRAEAARVPVHFVQAPVEHLPFADESFESAVTTLVFCSVSDPLRGLSEVRRVLKPGGVLLMIEHVRAQEALASTMQNIITPISRLLTGNCYWNRDTEQTVIEAGFKIEQKRVFVPLPIMPVVILQAVK
ncbi:MAG TPA: class I SAM-dependent methyltransferase [Ktedonobacteraceae bacterium]|jgi:ubiquinone/menaquinone biosynthesis C-methylase UbiE